MKDCTRCKFMTDYGMFLYCEIKDEIIRHEKRDALFCKYYRPNTANSEALQEFYDALNEVLDNYPEGGDGDGRDTLPDSDSD